MLEIYPISPWCPSKKVILFWIHHGGRNTITNLALQEGPTVKFFQTAGCIAMFLWVKQDLPNMVKRFFIVESCSSSAKMSSQRLFIKPDINLVVSKCGTHFLFWDKCFRTFIQVNKSNCWYKFIVTNLCGSGQNRVKRFNCWMCANIKHVWSKMWEAC